MNINPDKKSLLSNRLTMPPQRDRSSVDFGPDNTEPAQTLDKHDFATAPKPQLHGRIRMRTAMPHGQKRDAHAP
jgi:hypothetical protein